MSQSKKVNYRFQYYGTEPVSCGLEPAEKSDHPGLIFPNEEVVVSDVDTATWLRHLANWREVSSPTTDKPTHHRRKKAPAKSKAAPKKPAAPKSSTDPPAGDGSSE